MISRQHPFPADHGAAQRAGILIKALSLLGEVNLLVIGDERTGANAAPEWCRYVASLRLLPNDLHPCGDWFKRVPFMEKACRALFANSGFRHVPRISRQVHEIIRKGRYDVIVARYLTTFTLCRLQGMGSVVVDVDDLPSQAFETMIVNRQRNPLFKLIRQIQLGRIRKCSSKAARMCRHLWLPNLDQVAGFANASWLPNIPYPFFGQPAASSGTGEAAKRVLFVGLMSYTPNTEAMDFYVKAVWPKVLQAMPDAELRIVGGGLPGHLRDEWSRFQGVSLAGYVDDLAAEYGRCALVVAPIFSGGGTNIKVLEAMSHQRACLVSVPAASRFGSLLDDGKTALIASGPEEFAQKTLRLLSDPELRCRIGLAGFQAMNTTYSFAAVCREVARSIGSVVALKSH